jgi:hypothetical protein
MFVISKVIVSLRLCMVKVTVASYFTMLLSESIGLLLAIFNGYGFRFSLYGIFHSSTKVLFRRFLLAPLSIKASAFT